MELKLLTKKEVAGIFQCTTKSIETWIKDGKLTPCKNIPGDTRFTEDYIRKLIGVPFEKYSPMEYRRMQRELEETKQQLDYYKTIVADMDLLVSKVRAAQFKEASL